VVNRLPVVLAILAGAILLVLPAVLQDYPLHLAVMTGIFMILSVSLNLISGNAGIVSLGHAAFFAFGAYTASLLAKAGTPFFLGLLAGALLSGAVGLLLAFPALRVTGIYLTVITIAAGLIVHLLIMNLSITGGTNGLMGIPRPSLFGTALSSTASYYWLVLCLLLLTIGIVLVVEHSYIGRALNALRDDEVAATTLGISPLVYRVFAFALSSALAGLAGGLYAQYTRFIGPDSFTLDLSIRVLMMIVIGGLGSVWGSVLGTIVIYLLPEFLRFLNTYYFLVFGVFLTLMAMFMPDGLIALVRAGVQRVSRRRREGSLGDRRIA
jgi:branched-chain amino acid transport system permease protein